VNYLCFRVKSQCHKAFRGILLINIIGMKRTTFATILFILLLLGLGFAKTGVGLHYTWVLLAGLISGLVFIITKNKIALLIGLAICCFLLGWLRGSDYFQKLSVYDDLAGRQVVVEVTALQDAVYDDKGLLSFPAGSLFVMSPERTNLVGELDIAGRGEPAVYKGDKLTVEGKLYKKRGAQQGGISFANLKVIQKSNSSIDKLRREFAAGMQNALPEPLASFGLGLLIGQRNTLSEELTNLLIAVGLVHIIAVSGYNLTVIIHSSEKAFSKRSRYQSLIFSLSLIVLFLLLTGNSPSIVRAGIVSTLSLLAWYFGRRFKPVLLISLVAGLTALFNPLYLWTNIGWHLSFLAFFGILVLAPLLKKRFVDRKNQDKIVQTVLFETFSAQLLTLPLILYIFGRLSVVSILANALVVPLVPVAMLLSLFAGISGMTGFIFGGIVALPAEIILRYMLSISAVLSSVLGAYVKISINLSQMLILYGLIIILVVILQIKTKTSHDIIIKDIQ
jgi:competence protein ComEC